MTGLDEIRRAYPPGATIGRWEAGDGWPLRTFDWPAGANAARGSLLFLGGRGDVFEKYLEAFHHWHRAGWRITSFDWRAQGGSGRNTANPHVGDIADFARFVTDLDAYWTAWAAGAMGPRVVVCHSMGGHLMLRALAERLVAPDAAVLVAPMLGLHSPVGAWAGEKLARLMTRVGDPGRAAWKTNERPDTLRSRRSLLTHDDTRYQDEMWWQRRYPALLTGPPSWRWLAQAFRSTRRLNTSPALSTMRVPVLMLVAEADHLVAPRTALSVAARLPDVRIVRFGGESAHEILREADGVRDRALDEIDRFPRRPGTARFVTRYDIAIAGAGIAGATLAAELAPHASVVLIEAEDAAGYHATGRSAAFWSETYGGAHVQPLTTASREALGPYLAPLGSVHIGRAEDAPALDAFVAEFARSDVVLKSVDPAAFVPGLRHEWTLGVHEPSCAYIDVARLHADALAEARRAGAALRLSAGLTAARHDGRSWRIDTVAEPVSAAILVNAAGAWADVVAERAGVRPLDIRPYRRTLVQLRTDPAPPGGMPLISHIGDSFYFKPEAGGKLWLSPHDEVATPPCDARPEDIDVATAIDRFERVVDWRIAAVEHRWAGLRSFAPDRLPVYGFDPRQPAFFWCAGQGGFGIQTAPAAARLAAAQLLGVAPHQSVAAIDPVRYVPARFAP